MRRGRRRSAEHVFCETLCPGAPVAVCTCAAVVVTAAATGLRGGDGCSSARVSAQIASSSSTSCSLGGGQFTVLPRTAKGALPQPQCAAPPGVQWLTLVGSPHCSGPVAQGQSEGTSLPQRRVVQRNAPGKVAAVRRPLPAAAVVSLVPRPVLNSCSQETSPCCCGEQLMVAQPCKNTILKSKEKPSPV